jgi:hypothetical protein
MGGDKKKPSVHLKKLKKVKLKKMIKKKKKA